MTRSPGPTGRAKKSPSETFATKAEPPSRVTFTLTKLPWYSVESTTPEVLLIAKSASPLVAFDDATRQRLVVTVEMMAAASLDQFGARERRVAAEAVVLLLAVKALQPGRVQLGDLRRDRRPDRHCYRGMPRKPLVPAQHIACTANRDGHHRHAGLRCGEEAAEVEWHQAGSVTLSGPGQGTDIPSPLDPPGPVKAWSDEKIARAVDTVTLH